MKKIFLTVIFMSLFSCTSNDEQTFTNDIKNDQITNSEISREEDSEIIVGKRYDFSDETNRTATGKTVNIHIICNYFSSYSGQSTGYGQSYNGDYYYYWTTGYNPRVYHAKKVDSPHCL